MKKRYSFLLLIILFAPILNAQEKWVPTIGTSWWWQLEDAVTLNTNYDVEVYDIDLYEGKEFNKIKELQANGKKVICYFSAGTYEPYRPDKEAFDKKSFLNKVDGFEKEKWLNIRTDKPYLPNIKKIMKSRMQLAKDCGCDAVEPDNVDAWDNTRGNIRMSDQLAFNKWLAQTAHELGLSVGLKNDMAQLTELVDYFDFAVNEQCYAYDECYAYSNTFLKKNKAVFNQEYYDKKDKEGVLTKVEYEASCDYFKNNKIASLWKEGFNLNGKNVVECQTRRVQDILKE